MSDNVTIQEKLGMTEEELKQLIQQSQQTKSRKSQTTLLNNKPKQEK